MSFSRPYNETPADLAIERNVSAEVERATGLQFVKLSPYLYGIDWALFKRRGLIGWGEFKARAQKYDTYILSAAKLDRGLSFAERYRVPFYVFVRWPEGLCFYAARWEWSLQEYFPVQLGGNSRGQDGDMEPVVHIPVSRFKPIAEFPHHD